jgi:Fe-Mn family superoxide dismutase
MYEYYKFDLVPLRYSYNALEPFIDAATMALHHDKHLGTYVSNLNNTLSKYPQLQKWPLEKLIRNYRSLPKEIQITVKNNAGGVYNHNLFFNIMGPAGPESSADAITAAIEQFFGSMDDFKDEFMENALRVFGSGYTWLALNGYGKLTIVNTANQDTVLGLNLYPVLLIDVWEHAYYLKYKSRRADYIENWFHTINWASVQGYYNYYMVHNH